MLMESDFNLDTTIQLCKAREERQKQVKLMKELSSLRQPN